MDRKRKYKLTSRVALVSGLFCIVVALLLLLNFWQMTHDIRHVGLLMEKSYSTIRWQVTAGTGLILVGGFLMVFSLKLHLNQLARIERPEAFGREQIRVLVNTQYWLSLAVAVVLGLGVTSVFLNNDLLKNYNQMIIAEQPESGPESVDQDNLTVTKLSDSTTERGIPPTQVENISATEASAGTSVYPADEYKSNHCTYRGYMGQGISFHRNIPVSWNGMTGENIKWKVAFSKPGFNSPVIWGINCLFPEGMISQE